MGRGARWKAREKYPGQSNTMTLEIKSSTSLMEIINQRNLWRNMAANTYLYAHDDDEMGRKYLWVFSFNSQLSLTFHISSVHAVPVLRSSELRLIHTCGHPTRRKAYYMKYSSLHAIVRKANRRCSAGRIKPKHVYRGSLVALTFNALKGYIVYCTLRQTFD